MMFYEQRHDYMDNSMITFMSLLGKMGLIKSEEVENVLDKAIQDGLSNSFKDPTIPTRFESLVSNRIGCHYLRMMLESQLSVENADFLRRVQIYKTLPFEKISKEAQKIFHEFIEQNAPSQINISAQAVQQITQKIQNGEYTYEMFSDSANELFYLMKQNNVENNFSKSPFFARLIRRLYDFGVDNLKKPVITPLFPQFAKSTTPSLPRVSSDINISAQQFPPTQTEVKPVASPARPSKARSNSITALNGPHILATLSTPELYKDFKIFARSKGAERPIKFWKITTKFRETIASPEEVLTKAKEIYDNYILPIPSKVAIGFSQTLREELFEEIESHRKISSTFFDKAIEEVIELMKRTIYEEYLLSLRWEQVMGKNPDKALSPNLPQIPDSPQQMRSAVDIPPPSAPRNSTRRKSTQEIGPPPGPAPQKNIKKQTTKDDKMPQLPSDSLHTRRSIQSTSPLQSPRTDSPSVSDIIIPPPSTKCSNIDPPVLRSSSSSSASDVSGKAEEGNEIISLLSSLCSSHDIQNAFSQKMSSRISAPPEFSHVNTFLESEKATIIQELPNLISSIKTKIIPSLEQAPAHPEDQAEEEISKTLLQLGKYEKSLELYCPEVNCSAFDDLAQTPALKLHLLVWVLCVKLKRMMVRMLESRKLNTDAVSDSLAACLKSISAAAKTLIEQ
eukprot:TRINITY_DN8027_c0_g1_i1.p1 TRINITY_DN8027_c0_g1~~TRINITY_DN8027_c0_g1_i1.p1  ORF type:complete len:691 (-),score=188.53 TRINITY_DN8027_c0_g1_i1:114-2147(-)